MELLVNEMFSSIQGEGILIGQPSIFLRLAMCNVNCPGCDTDYMQGMRVSMDEVIKAITGPYARGGVRHLVITGGEPYIHKELPLFIEAIWKHPYGFHITIETSGTIIPATFEPISLVSVSPKLCSLKPGPSFSRCDMENTFYELLDKPRREMQVKFVWNGSDADIPDQIVPDMVKRLHKAEIPVIFQPYTDGAKFEKYSYARDLEELAIKVKQRFGGWPRTLPQLHKLMRMR